MAKELKHHGIEVNLQVSFYATNFNLAVELATRDLYDGHLEPYCDLTVNVEEKQNKNEAYIKTYEIPGLEEFIIKNKLGKIVDNCYLQTDNGAIPLYKFNEERLKELDMKGYESYLSINKEEYPELFQEQEELSNEKENQELNHNIGFQEPKIR